MSIITTDNRYYTEIADAIRSKNGTSNTYRPSEMSTAIEELSNNEALIKIVERSWDLTSLSAEDLKGITKIGDYAFHRCGCLNSIEIPNTVTSIGVNALTDTSIREITIPDSVTYIDSYAIGHGANSSYSIIIGKNVSYIGLRAFHYSTFGYMELRCTTPPTLYSSESIYSTRTDGTAFENLTIHVPVGCGDAYKTATNWSAFADYIVDDIVVE